MGKTRQRQQKTGNLKQRQAAGNPDGTDMAEGGQTKDYLNLLFENSDFISTPREGGYDGGGQKPDGSCNHTTGQISLLVKIGETVILRSSRIIPLECIMVLGPGAQQSIIDQATEEKIQVAIHPEYPEQTVAIG
nr:hypothetical protein [Tanacetum cinerariifolium]